jgi:hypothetical protein
LVINASLAVHPLIAGLVSRSTSLVKEASSIIEAQWILNPDGLAGLTLVQRLIEVALKLRLLHDIRLDLMTNLFLTHLAIFIDVRLIIPTSPSQIIHLILECRAGDWITPAALYGIKAGQAQALPGRTTVGLLKALAGLTPTQFSTGVQAGAQNLCITD